MTEYFQQGVDIYQFSKQHRRHRLSKNKKASSRVTLSCEIQTSHQEGLVYYQEGWGL